MTQNTRRKIRARTLRRYNWLSPYGSLFYILKIMINFELWINFQHWLLSIVGLSFNPLQWGARKIKLCIRTLFCVISKIQKRTKWCPLQKNDTQNKLPRWIKFFFNLYSYGTGNLSPYDFRPTLFNLYLLTTFRFLWFPRIFVDNLIENEAVYYNNHCKKKSGSPLNFFSKINLRINFYYFFYTKYWEDVKKQLPVGFSLCAHVRPRDDHHGKFLGMWNEKSSFSENSDDHRLKYSQNVKAPLQFM